MTNEEKIKDLKVQVYDLIATAEQYQQMFQKLQLQIAELNKQIAELQQTKS